MVRFLLYILLPVFSMLSCSSRSDHTLVVWAHFDPPEKKLVQKQINQFAEENPGWDFKLMTFSEQEIKTLYPLSVIGGAGPAILYGSTTEIGQLSELNVLEPMESLFDSTFLGGFSTQTLNPVEKIKNPVTGQRHIYQITDQIVNQIFFIYNKDHWSFPLESETNREKITFSELFHYCVKTTNPAKYSLVWDYSRPDLFYFLISGFGGSILDQYNQPQLDSKAVIASLLELRDINKKGIAFPEECNSEQARLYFIQKKASLIADRLYHLKEYEKAGIKVGVMRFPPVGQAQDWPKQMVAGNGFSINPVLAETQKKLASKLISYLCTKERQLERVKISYNLPLLTEALNDASIQSDSLFNLVIKQVLNGSVQPSSPESNLTLQVLVSGYRQFLKDRTLSAGETTRKMQNGALKQIRDIRK